MAEAGVGSLRDGWFSEVNDQWPGLAMSFKVDEVLLDKRSEYQHVQVFRSAAFGNVLVLDGVIQCTEKDEMAYQEMITHLPMFSHPEPKHVLVVGGGDGGVIREVLKHPSVERVVICEIDQLVIDASKKYLPKMAAAWDDARVHLHRGDAAAYIRQPECRNSFDVIISDTSDPVGPAAALFEGQFYSDLSEALRPGGRLATQAESIWLHLDLIQKLVREASPYFDSVEYATTQIPTYPCGQIGFLICAKGSAQTLCRDPVRGIPQNAEDAFHYYSSDLHRAAFILPKFVQSALEGNKEPASPTKSATKQIKEA